MEKEVKEYTCTVCQKNYSIEDMFINKYHMNRLQKPIFQQVQDYCKNCHSKKKTEQDKEWRKKNVEKYRKYQAEYHRKRKKDKLIPLVDGIMSLFLKNKLELNIPSEVFCQERKTFVKGFLFIEQKEKLRDWANKHKIKNQTDFINYFNNNCLDAYLFCQKEFELKSISQIEMIRKRVKYNSDNIRLLQPSDINCLEEKLKKDSLYNQSVIVTYLYFINNKLITDDFTKILLPIEKIQESNMFGKQTVNYNGKKYVYYSSSKYATKYILRKFEINFKNLEDKRELIFNYVNNYIIKVCKNPDKAGYITNVIMAGYNRLMFDLQNQIDAAKKTKK